MSGLEQPASSCSESISSPEGDRFIVRFWGVRGSIPTPSPDTIRYGGNTACVEMQVGHHLLIFDGGTGLHMLGKHLLNRQPIEAHLFFTHTHWDRIQGFPFFIPAFMEGNTFHIYGAVGLNGASIKQRLSDQMLRPNFPVPLQVMQSNLTFHNITPGSVINLDDITVETISLNQPNSALGYRVSWQGCSVVYATDTEHNPDKLDQNLLYLADRADLLIYDAAYADHAYYNLAADPGSHDMEAWHAGVKVGMTAKVREILLFHHNPEHDDDFLDATEREVQSTFSNVRLAREGMVLDVKAIQDPAC
ncbi:MAG: MBL fold metallo-hydrolase [Synechococcales cyanobacterium T60_A2020_003]|nr:MBL fold metallo-hydrolase [Synechococcales cyanobacterium T60_A2020_003]